MNAMATPNPSEHVEREYSPAAHRLKEALGWDKFPEMTAEQREAFEEANRRADEEAERFYNNRAS